jgi:hypothetical protein
MHCCECGALLCCPKQVWQSVHTHVWHRARQAAAATLIAVMDARRVLLGSASALKPLADSFDGRVLQACCQLSFWV